MSAFTVCRLDARGHAQRLRSPGFGNLIYVPICDTCGNDCHSPAATTPVEG